MNSIFIELKLDEKTLNFEKFKERQKKRILDEKNKVVQKSALNLYHLTLSNIISKMYFAVSMFLLNTHFMTRN